MPVTANSGISRSNQAPVSPVGWSLALLIGALLWMLIFALIF